MNTWILTSGINTFVPKVQDSGLAIWQKEPEEGDKKMLREQIVDVAVFKFGKDNQIELKEVFPNILIQFNFNITPVPNCNLD